MADLTIDPANVQMYDGVLLVADRPVIGPVSLIADVAIIAGEAVYLNERENLTVALAVNTGAETALCIGIAVKSAAAESSILVAPAGAYVDLGITLTEGTIYCVSAAGKIAPIADLGSGDFVSIIGVGTDTAGILDLMPLGATGYSIP